MESVAWGWQRKQESPSVYVRGVSNACGGLEVPNLPLSAPTGVQLATISPKLVEGVFC
jgi:hypothetical protein